MSAQAGLQTNTATSNGGLTNKEKGQVRKEAFIVFLMATGLMYLLKGEFKFLREKRRK